VLAVSVLGGDQLRTYCQQLADIIPSKMKGKFKLRLVEDSVNTPCLGYKNQSVNVV
jgi:hypothetical protein